MLADADRIFNAANVPFLPEKKLNPPSLKPLISRLAIKL